MSTFSGFPAKAGVTPIPNPFFSQLLAQIDSLDELRVTLYIFFLIYRQRGSPRFAALNQLLADRGLTASLSPQRLETALAAAASRGTILHLELSLAESSLRQGTESPSAERSGRSRHLYLINNEEGRATQHRLRQGELAPAVFVEETPAEPLPNIFTLYEENIGLLTPIIAQELEVAAERYPPAWIRAAFAEAVALNKRSWRYISRILERWEREGRSDAAPGRDSAEADKYIRGKYGRFVRR